MGLAHQPDNRVTLSYRGDAFTRIKERNSKRLQDALKSGRLSLLLRSLPVEIRAQEVLVEQSGKRLMWPNDFTWVFAGGTPPNAFLERIGVRLGQRDLTAEGADALRVA